MCLQARGPKVMDWTVEDGGQELDWPRTIWRLSQRRHQSSLSNQDVVFLRNKQMRSSRRVSEEAQRSAHIKGSVQRDKSLFLHLLKNAHPLKSAAEGEWLVYISNFLVMVGFKIRAVKSCDLKETAGVTSRHTHLKTGRSLLRTTSSRKSVQLPASCDLKLPLSADDSRQKHSEKDSLKENFRRLIRFLLCCGQTCLTRKENKRTWSQTGETQAEEPEA